MTNDCDNTLLEDVHHLIELLLQPKNGFTTIDEDDVEGEESLQFLLEIFETKSQWQSDSIHPHL